MGNRAWNEANLRTLTITRVSAKFQADDDNLAKWRTRVTKEEEEKEERLLLPTGDEFLIALTLQWHRDIANCQSNRFFLPFFSFFYKSKKFKTNDIYPCIQKILKIHISLYRSNNSFQVCCQDIFSIKQSKNRRYNIFYTNNTKYREYKSNSSLQPSPKSGQ